jgi:hypothetical protein
MHPIGDNPKFYFFVVVDDFVTIIEDYVSNNEMGS